MSRCAHRVAFCPAEPSMVEEILQERWDQAYAAGGIPMEADCKLFLRALVQAFESKAWALCLSASRLPGLIP